MSPNAKALGALIGFIALVLGACSSEGGSGDDTPLVVPGNDQPMAGNLAMPPADDTPPVSTGMDQPTDVPGSDTPVDDMMGDDATDDTDLPAGAEIDPTTPLDQIPDRCKGFDVLGLEYSPGGSVLPNTCAPFHNVLNNPYSIRCIDADPSYDTGWPGDEWCILPPDPELGIQIGVHPESYENPDADVAPGVLGFVLPAGTEVTQNYYASVPNDQAFSFYREVLRMRTGSHHIINTMTGSGQSGWTNSQDTGLGAEGIIGSQRPDSDRPTGTLDVPPENAGHGQTMPAGQNIQYNMHHFNFSEEPMLREIWINIWFKDASEITEQLGGIGIFGNPADLFAIGPGEHAELHYVCDVTGNTRIVTLNGHRHSHTDRFGAWIERANGEVLSVYESFEYQDMPTYQYDSISQNPVPDLDARIDGASSGLLEVGPGDEIHFVCDITNRLDTNLRFANQVDTGEMCILFGSRTGSSLCGMNTRRAN